MMEFSLFLEIKHNFRKQMPDLSFTVMRKNSDILITLISLKLLPREDVCMHTQKMMVEIEKKPN